MFLCRYISSKSGFKKLDRPRKLIGDNCRASVLPSAQTRVDPATNVNWLGREEGMAWRTGEWFSISPSLLLGCGIWRPGLLVMVSLTPIQSAAAIGGYRRNSGSRRCTVKMRISRIWREGAINSDVSIFPFILFRSSRRRIGRRNRLSYNNTWSYVIMLRVCGCLCDWKKASYSFAVLLFISEGGQRYHIFLFSSKIVCCIYVHCHPFGTG